MRSGEWSLQEYNASLDVKEATSRLRILAVPFFHHELVKQALVLVIEEGITDSAIVDLFNYLSSDTGTISVSQMVKVGPALLLAVLAKRRS